MSRDEGFLARWSRRKREEAAPGPEPAQAPPAEAPAEPELPPDELALLPRLEDITAETELGAFLRQGVPAPLRNAALRRAWALDPAIRDRVGDALDYAWDYNTPGATPGFGPIEPEMDVAGMVRSMFSRPPGEPAPAEVAEATGPEPTPDEVDGQAGEDGPDEEPAAAEPALLTAELDGAAVPARPEPAEAPALSHPTPPRRRHGGALPL